MYAGEKRQDIVAGIICLGPILDMTKAAGNFENAAKQFYTEREKKQVEALRDKSDIDFFMPVSGKLAEKYTNCAHYKGKEAHDTLSSKWFLRLFTSKDWCLSDVWSTIKMSSTPGKRFFPLWSSLLKINLTETLNKITVPILFLQGSEELYVLPEELENISAAKENITYRKFLHCGHIPTAESFPDMLDEMVKFGISL